MSGYSAAYVADLLRELVKLPSECEWLEFKRDYNGQKPELVGENISALANAAARLGKPNAYMVWGVEDEAHRIVGTDFNPAKKKVRGELLENWLLRKLKPKAGFQFYLAEVEGKHVVLLDIASASGAPVAFDGVEFMRSGPITKKLRDVSPDLQRDLWRAFDQTPFESSTAASHVSGAEVARLLDCADYFRRLRAPMPSTEAAMLDALAKDKIVATDDAGGWNISNMGALLFANNLSDFASVWRKKARIVRYAGRGRTESVGEREIDKGYATGFAEILSAVEAWLPASEAISNGIRTNGRAYPDIAVRELAANALIHQDLSAGGAGPMVEIFADRVEFCNPGAPLVDAERFITDPPKTRNERVAALMRRFGICEERGSGMDKAVQAIEDCHLPALKIEALRNATRVIMFARKALRDMDRAERVRACYQHACLRYANNQYLSNSSLRARFGMGDEKTAMASRYIAEAVAEGVIKPYEENASRRQMRYEPVWA